MESSHACTGSSTPRGPPTARDSAASGVAFRRFRARRHPGQAQFRGSITGLRAPLSTLRCALTGRQRMTRGHRDSLDLRCRTLSFPSLMPVVRRFPENGASGEAATLAERWNGKRWTILPSPNVGGFLLGVSCATGNACTAVGTTTTAPEFPTLAERWNGKRWSIQTTVSYGRFTFPLGAVSCASRIACLAVTGDVLGGDCLCAGSWGAQSWDGNKWSPLPEQPPVRGSTGGASCPSPSECIVVDNSGAATWAGRWNGKRWTIDQIGGTGGLDSVSCPSGTVCTAVGGYSSSYAFQPELPPGCTYTGESSCGSRPAAARWSGKRWSIQSTPSPTGATSSGLAAVSCATTTTCTAVGSYDDAAGRQSVLVERWHGTG